MDVPLLARVTDTEPVCIAQRDGRIDNGIALLLRIKVIEAVHPGANRQDVRVGAGLHLGLAPATRNTISMRLRLQETEEVVLELEELLVVLWEACDVL